MSKQEFGRRDFLKLAGLSTAVGGAAITASAAAPKAAKASLDTPHNGMLSFVVKEIDTPSYDLEPFADGSKLPKPTGLENAFVRKEFVDSIKGDFPIHFAQLEANGVKNALEGKEGWSLRDLAFTGSAETGAGLCEPLENWGFGYQNKYQPIIDRDGAWDKGADQNALTVKKIAHYYGAGACGICELNRNWMYDYFGGGKASVYFSQEHSKKMTFSKDVTELVQTETEVLIPDSVNRAIVCLIPLEFGMGRFAPTGLNPENGLAYSRLCELVTKLAECLRGMGWIAIPCQNDTALSIPLAIDAGLGELGRHGILINPEYGSACKICKVLTNMPLATDKPILFGAGDFCRTCGKCADACPSKSIQTNDVKETSYDVQCACNIPGMKKWYVNTETCMEYWMNHAVSGCNVCASTCTYSKPQTWVHDIIKLTISKTSIFNSIFTKMDEAFGYGETWSTHPEEGAIEEWWADTSFTRPRDFSKVDFYRM